jgi:hypothetical protein
MALRRILLASLIAAAAVVAWQTAEITLLLLTGRLPVDPVVAYAIALLIGVLLFGVLVGVGGVAVRIGNTSTRAEVSVQRPLQDTVGICVAAAQATGWEVTQQPTGTSSRALFIGKEPWTFSWHNPATLEMEIEPVGEIQCLVRMTTSNVGLGPIQSGYVKQRLDATREAIRQRA